MRKLIFALFAIGCGKSECQNYATVYCNKAVQCGYNINGVMVRPDRTQCEKEANAQLQAQGSTEAQCTAGKTSIGTMSCEQFQRVAAGNM